VAQGSGSDKDAEIAAIKRQVEAMEVKLEALKVKLEELEKEKEEKASEAAPAPAPTSSALLNPDLTLIGDILGRSGNDASDRDRDRLRLSEIEAGIQSRVYPDIRADMFISLPREEDFKAELEEGYLTFLRLGSSGLGAKMGKMRTPIGKVNTLHPHSLLYVDSPAPLRAFLGADGLNTNGAIFSYLFPSRSNLFARAELGLWDIKAPALEARLRGGGRAGPVDEEALGPGIDNTLRTARLWLSKALGEAAELELGSSYAWGKAPEEGGRRDQIDLLAFDVTYRRWPGTFSRIMLQGEYLSHRHDAVGGQKRRDGYYLFAGYKPTRYWEYGLRYDLTAFPFPIEGRESSLSAILTNYLNETTFARLQLKHGSRPGKDSFSEIWLQFVFGAGPHAHPLQ